MATLKLGLEDVTALDLVPYAQGIHDRMQGNALFPAPIPALPVLQTDIDALKDANARVSVERGRSDYQAKRIALGGLQRQMKRLAAYVSLVADGNEDIILSSGFGVRRKGSPVGELNIPIGLHSRLTRTAGRVELDWDVTAGAKLYHVYMSTTGSPFEWKLVAMTTKSRHNMDQLVSGSFYWFCVSAIGTAGESSLSNALRAMAAA